MTQGKGNKNRTTDFVAFHSNRTSLDRTDPRCTCGHRRSWHKGGGCSKRIVGVEVRMCECGGFKEAQP